MVTKILAWSSFGAMLLFVIVVATFFFTGYDVPDEPAAAYWKAVLVASPLVTSILLAVALLVWSAFDSES